MNEGSAIKRTPAQMLAEDREYVRSLSPEERLELLEQIRAEVYGEKYFRPFEKIIRILQKPES